jgi:pyruvate/2-oxoglutarate dehydrogenase complex dihydrolipoamide dehydrogenase (E3) component
MDTYDLIIIGAGSGGLSAAYTAVGFGKRVLLVDKELPGGECTWSGCIPSKALIHEAQLHHHARIIDSSIRCDTAQVLNRVRKVIANVYEGESPKSLSRDGISFKSGVVKLIDAHNISLGQTKYHAKKMIIATGSSPRKLSVEGIESIVVHDNTSLFKLKALPNSMIIIGGGPIGVEMAQALNRLGVEVDLVVKHGRILIREDKHQTLALQRVLESEGVRVHFNALAVKAEKSGDQSKVMFKQEDKIMALEAEAVFSAIGRIGNTEGLGLNKIGVESEKNRIRVNAYLETTAKDVYAVGDVAGPYLFSHMANVQAIQAVQNAFLPFKKKVDYSHVAWTVFTEPEYSRAGLTQKETKDKYGDDMKRYCLDFKNLDRAMTKGETQESIKVFTDKKGHIVGASVLADRSGELISEIQVLKTLKLPLYKLAGVIHPYPTYSEALVKLGKKAAIDRITSNPFVKFFRGE